MKKWTNEEIEWLKTYCNESEEFLTNLFEGRTWKSIKHKITNMNLPRVKEYSRYSKEEDEIIRNNSHLPVAEIQKLLPNRKVDSILQRYRYLGLEWTKTWDFWSEDEINIIELFDDIDEMIAYLPNRTKESIYLKAKKMGKILNDYWTDEEIDILKDNYGLKHVYEFIHLLPNRNEQAIYIKANRLNLEGKMGKGGITPINKAIRFSKQYKHWRESIFEKDDYTCQKCNKRGGDLQAHHILPFSHYIELRFDINNGITLCREHHDSTIKGSFHNTYGTHNNTREQLEEFLERKLNQQM